MGLIKFERSVETATFFSPLAGMELADQTIEVRRDPLTGMTAVSSSELVTKEEMFYGKTDWAHADDLAARRSRLRAAVVGRRQLEECQRDREW